MTPTPPPQLDIVSVAILLAGALFGREVAQVAGPYGVILLASIGGAAWSAARQGERTRASTLRNMFLMVGLALLVTVPLAAVASSWVGIESRWLLGPVAAVIAGVGPEWFVGLIGRLVKRKVGLPAPEDTPHE
jgi:Ca2+/Na+ antiporter